MSFPGDCEVGQPKRRVRVRGWLRSGASRNKFATGEREIRFAKKVVNFTVNFVLSSTYLTLHRHFFTLHHFTTSLSHSTSPYIQLSSSFFFLAQGCCSKTTICFCLSFSFLLDSRILISSPTQRHQAICDQHNDFLNGIHYVSPPSSCHCQTSHHQ